MAKPLDLPNSLRAFHGGWVCIETTQEALAFINAVSRSQVRSPEWLCLQDAFRRVEESGDIDQLHRAYEAFRQQLIRHGWLRDPDALPLVTPLELRDRHHRSASLACSLKALALRS
jgi:hypothetical protein